MKTRGRIHWRLSAPQRLNWTKFSYKLLTKHCPSLSSSTLTKMPCSTPEVGGACRSSSSSEELQTNHFPANQCGGSARPYSYVRSSVAWNNAQHRTCCLWDSQGKNPPNKRAVEGGTQVPHQKVSDTPKNAKSTQRCHIC